MKKISYFWRKGLWTIFSLLMLAIISFCILYIYLENGLPDVETLKSVQLQVPLQIYTEDNKLIAEFGEKRRIPVTYEKIPKRLVQAILSTEDQRFFEHPGIDFLGLARASFELLKTGKKAQGGSTITMQVARNFFLTRKKTFLRKFNEILLAIKIDNEFSKEKILELYLNKIYLGNRAYGVAAAAKIYYGKSLDELNLAQIAMIAGLPQAPSSQNPLASPKAALKRRNHVLQRLLEEEFINKQEYVQAINAPITAKYHPRTTEVKAAYVAEMIRQSMVQHFGDNAYNNGYHVYTSIDSKLQNAANQALEDALLNYTKRHGYRGPLKHLDLNQLNEVSDQLVEEIKQFATIEDLKPALIIGFQDNTAQAMLANKQVITLPFKGIRWARAITAKNRLSSTPTQVEQVLRIGDIVYVRKNKQWQLSQLPQVEGALVSLSPKDGAILALVGGYNFRSSKFNRVIQAKRQPGSSFKPFIYAAALAKGFTLASIINDAPVVVDDPSQETLWRPHNHTQKFYGPTRLRVGLVRSINLVSIRLLESIGLEYAINYLEKFGFKKADLPQSLSLALGSLTVTPLEITSAYATFANGGFKIEPYLIKRITNAYGQDLLVAKPKIACNQCDDLPANEKAPQIIDDRIAYLIDSTLKEVVQNGTGRGAKVLKRQDIAGKTGTTNDKFDAWFTGYSGNIVTSTWVGFDSPKSLKEYASRVALPMWVDYMKVALKGKDEATFEQPNGLVTVRINKGTGLKTSENKNSRFELFRIEHVPEKESLLRLQKNRTDKENKIEDLF